MDYFRVDLSQPTNAGLFIYQIISSFIIQANDIEHAKKIVASAYGDFVGETSISAVSEIINSQKEQTP